MKKLFVDVSPGFYKTKLFNALSKRIDILVVYTTGYDKSTRNEDFLSGERHYPYVQLTGSLVKQCFDVCRILRKEPFDEVVIGGYDSVVSWITLLFSKKEKNALLLESTFRETTVHGIKVILKKFFFSRLRIVYACGAPHEKLARMFGFTGICKRLNSVGLFNVVEQPPFQERKLVSKFLFVGRLIWQKNLGWLIRQFSKHPELELNIIGFGDLEAELKAMVKTGNIHFLGAVKNAELPNYYQDSDVFILPSLTETWGLVIEEALNNGTPIMCSNMVGSADDLVAARKTGVIFELDNEADFEQQLREITNVVKYNEMRKHVSEIDFEQYEESVINALLN